MFPWPPPSHHHLDVLAQEADAEPADAGPLLVTVTLKAFKDDKKVGVIKEIKRIMAEADPKFNLAAVRRHALASTIGVEQCAVEFV